MEIITRGAVESFELAKKIGRSLKVGAAFFLHGELGAGKTVFTKGLAAGLAVAEEITSPTYVFLRSYRGRDFNFYHLDLYRIERGEEMARIDLEEVLSDRRAVVVVEWPKFLDREKFGNLRQVFFENLSENERKIRIEEG